MESQIAVASDKYKFKCMAPCNPYTRILKSNYY